MLIIAISNSSIQTRLNFARAGSGKHVCQLSYPFLTISSGFSCGQGSIQITAQGSANPIISETGVLTAKPSAVPRCDDMNVIRNLPACICEMTPSPRASQSLRGEDCTTLRDPHLFQFLACLPFRPGYGAAGSLHAATSAAGLHRLDWSSRKNIP
jgi:hypothetical protein